MYVIYSHFITNDLSDSSMSWQHKWAMVIFDHYTKYVGRLLSGTQWLIVVFRQCGACIADDVIIDDINSLYDVHLITIGNHTRLSATCQIQVRDF